MKYFNPDDIIEIGKRIRVKKRGRPPRSWLDNWVDSLILKLGIFNLLEKDKYGERTDEWFNFFDRVGDENFDEFDSEFIWGNDILYHRFKTPEETVFYQFDSNTTDEWNSAYPRHLCKCGNDSFIFIGKDCDTVTCAECGSRLQLFPY